MELDNEEKRKREKETRKKILELLPIQRRKETKKISTNINTINTARDVFNDSETIVDANTISIMCVKNICVPIQYLVWALTLVRMVWIYHLFFPLGVR